MLQESRRVEGAEGFGGERAVHGSSRSGELSVASDLDLAIRSKAFALDAHGLCVMQQSVQ
jgi:predicted nucleotidyltransferase